MGFKQSVKRQDKIVDIEIETIDYGILRYQIPQISSIEGVALSSNYRKDKTDAGFGMLDRIFSTASPIGHDISLTKAVETFTDEDFNALMNYLVELLTDNKVKTAQNQVMAVNGQNNTING